MGQLIAKLMRIFGSQEHKVIIVGLDNAGKTTILYQFLTNEVVHTCSTIGSNVEEIVLQKTRFLMWDLGGQEVLRSSWDTYYSSTEFVILVIDSTDRNRLLTTREELYKMLAHEGGPLDGGGGSYMQPGQLRLMAMRLKPAWASHRAPGQPGLQSKILFGTSRCLSPDLCQQAGCERLHEHSGDLPVPHTQCHQGPPVAYPGLLCPHRRRAASWTSVDAVSGHSQLKLPPEAYQKKHGWHW
uniref:putative ADP-ribosylation factor-like protein 5C isoform X2 n=1 Tax=Myodes glareolus TaxID=447135 RepID=UPI00202229C2|nr:putative ADP-ribosylation factor-like protein 5C isoform X2 [Myodes glareolus]